MNRENFNIECSLWCGSYMRSIFCCCCRGSHTASSLARRQNLFEKGRRAINLDLDLRTYLKNIRNV